MKTEREKMLDGEMYMPWVEELVTLRNNARKIFREYNQNPNAKLLDKLFGKQLNDVRIEPPFYCDYGTNIELGRNVYMNFNCCILDCAKVTIGENTLLAPNVQIYTAQHPLDAEKRNRRLENALPVTIGKNCWIGGGAIILPNVTIGDNCVIGAGSVVTKDIPPHSLAVGNPARVIKQV